MSVKDFFIWMVPGPVLRFAIKRGWYQPDEIPGIPENPSARSSAADNESVSGQQPSVNMLKGNPFAYLSATTNTLHKHRREQNKYAESQRKAATVNPGRCASFLKCFAMFFSATPEEPVYTARSRSTAAPRKSRR